MKVDKNGKELCDYGVSNENSYQRRNKYESCGNT